MQDELSDLEKQYFETNGETDLAENKTETEAAEPQNVEKTEEQKQPAQEKTPETLTEVDPNEEQEQQVKAKKVVPLAALQEERQRRQDLQRQIEDLRNQIANNSKNEQIQELQNDPIARIEQMEQATHFQTAMMTTRMAEIEFIQENPDYHDAIDFLSQRRAEQLVLLGIPEEKIENIVSQERISLAMQALNNGRNPAEIAYKLAKANGYQEKAQEPEKPVQDQAKQVGKQIEKISEAEKASRSIGSIAGKAPSNSNIQTLLDMSEKDISNLSPQEFERLFSAS